MTTRQAQFSEFTRPESELDSLQQALENMLVAYREQESRFDYDPDGDELKTLCDHRMRFDGNFDQLEARLNTKLDDTPYTAAVDTRLSIKELDDLLASDTTSLPLTELHPDYYDEVRDEYDVQPGEYGVVETPMVIPVMVEEDMVIYWDPLYDFFEADDDGSTELTMSDTVFFELWSLGERTRWTIWIDRTAQDTLARFTEEDSQ